MTQPISPAHDLVGEQHSAHFGILVLPFIDDGLGEGECTGWRGRRLLSSPRAVQRWAVDLHWHLPRPGCGESLPRENIMPSTLL